MSCLFLNKVLRSFCLRHTLFTILLTEVNRHLSKRTRALNEIIGTILPNTLPKKSIGHNLVVKKRFNLHHPFGMFIELDTLDVITLLCADTMKEELLIAQFCGFGACGVIISLWVAPVKEALAVLGPFDA